MERKHKLFFCTECGFRLTGQEYVCPNCNFKLAEQPANEIPVVPKTEIPPVTEPKIETKPVEPVAEVKTPTVNEVKPVEPVKDAKPAAPAKEIKTKETLRKTPPKPDTKEVKKKKGLGILWIILIIFFGIVIIGGGTVGFLQYNGNIDIPLLKEYIPSKQKPLINETPKKDTMSQKQNEVKQQNSDTTTSNLNSANEKPAETNQSNTAPKTGGNIFIIAGSYSTMQLAQEAVNNLKAKGFDGAKVVGQNDGGNWRICYNSFSSEQEAMNELSTIRQNENPSAWIFKQQ